MKVVHVITNLSTGGAELMLRRLIRAQAHDRAISHEVISLMSKSSVGKLLHEDEVSADVLGARSLYDLPRTVTRLVAELRRRKPDVVHCWMYHADLIGGLCARASGVGKVIWGVRTADIGPHQGIPRTTKWIRSICARLSRSVPSAIVYVAESARIAHERIGYDSSKSIVIPNGYAVPPPVDREAVRGELGISPGELVVVSVGRAAPYKDPGNFVRAAALAARRRPELRFMMVGNGYSSENRELAGLIAKQGCTDRFRLLGERPDVARLLPAADIFCLHSRLEGFPNALAEAMLAGLPCVTTDVGDARLLLGGNGSVVAPGDPDALAQAMIDLAVLGPQKRRSIGRRARQHVEAHYSIDSISKRYSELYRKLVAEDVMKHSASALQGA